MHLRSERFLTFYLDQHLCAIHVAAIREINEPRSEWKASSREVDLRGETLRFYDLRSKLGLERSQPTDKSRLLVLNIDEVLQATLVDSVHAVIDLYADQWEAVSESDLAPFAHPQAFQGIANWRGKAVLLLDPKQLFRTSRERTIA